MKQFLILFFIDLFGLIYLWLEGMLEYPDDHEILGINIDKDLQNMSRRQLCRYMDAVLPKKGFFKQQSTTKIRLGCQLLRNYNELRNE